MRTIWRFDLMIEDEQTIEMPAGAEIIRMAPDRSVMWAIVDPEQPTQKRTYHTYGTGHEMPDRPGKYVGTYEVAGGSYVFHVFEVTR